MKSDEDMLLELEAMQAEIKKEAEENLTKLRLARAQNAIATQLFVDHFEVILKLGKKEEINATNN